MTVGFGEFGEDGNGDVFAKELDGVTEVDIGDFGDVDHHLIHADEPGDIGPVIVDKDLGFIAEGPGVAIAISDAEGGDFGFNFGLPGAVVGDSFSGLDGAD